MSPGGAASTMGPPLVLEIDISSAASRREAIVEAKLTVRLVKAEDEDALLFFELGTDGNPIG